MQENIIWGLELLCVIILDPHEHGSQPLHRPAIGQDTNFCLCHTGQVLAHLNIPTHWKPVIFPKTNLARFPVAQEPSVAPQCPKHQAQTSQPNPPLLPLTPVSLRYTQVSHTNHRVSRSLHTLFLLPGQDFASSQSQSQPP